MDDHRALPLTARQRDVLMVIVRFTEATGEVPSVLYVARRLVLSRAAVREHLVALHRKGWLQTPAPAGLQCLHVPPQ
jgi:Mn-dependent DtxR family transcriptional regulator